MKQWCLIVLLLVLVACNTTQVIPVADSQKQKEYVSSAHIKSDTTIIERWHYIYEKKDTVYRIDSIKERICKLEYVYDTIHTSDTIIKTQIVLKEKSLSSWQRFMRNSGYALWLIIILIVLVIVASLMVRFIK